MKNIALVFAGGTGQRMGANIPKQFLQVCGKEIIVRTLELFENNDKIEKIYCVCIEEYIPFLQKLIVKYELNKVTKIVPGGSSGLDSIYNGLVAIKLDNENCNVLIHDGVRPLVSGETISNCIEMITQKGSAVTVTPCFETPIISIDGNELESTLQRNITYMAQAPQCFQLNDILSAHELERKKTNPYEGIIDSCGLMHKYGYKCFLVKGNRGNVKVTTVEDLFNLISNYNYNDYKFVLDLNNKER